jgi:hypothetical protein
MKSRSEILDTAEMSSRIERAYQESGNKLGWRFLYSPVSAIADAKIAFIGLNPGGSERSAAHADFAMTTGSAYCDETWAGHSPGESPLQLQVQALFSLIGVPPAEVLAGNLVPFRSATWNSLIGRQEALSFGGKLWSDVLAFSQPQLVVAMGVQVRNEMAAILGISELTALPTGWGSVRAARGENGRMTLIGIPHLSRFRIFGRPNSTDQIASIFAGFIQK